MYIESVNKISDESDNTAVSDWGILDDYPVYDSDKPENKGIATVPLNYNFISTCVVPHGFTHVKCQNLLCK